MKNLFWIFALVVASFVSTPPAIAARPNIVVILTDDQGYADISLNPHHGKEVATQHKDALAKDGVVFSQGYTSGHVCSPTRAGIVGPPSRLHEGHLFQSHDSVTSVG